MDTYQRRVVRPEGPSINSHDRQVVVTVLEMIEEIRGTGVDFVHIGPSGLVAVDADCDADPTGGAIS